MTTNQTYTLDIPLSKAIDAAVKAGACEDDIERLRALAKPGMTIGDLDGNPDAAYWAYWFAKDVIKGRFEAAEAAIASVPYYALLYAEYRIKGRFEAGEAAIATSKLYSRRYSKIPGVPSNWRTTA